jgi:hypothetical protein
MKNANMPIAPVAYVELEHTYSGLTKREHIAAIALSSMNLIWDGAYGKDDRDAKRPEQEAKWAAVAAIRYADALLRELDKGQAQ